VKLNKVNIAITNEKLNKEDMARLLGRGGVGDFGGCGAKILLLISTVLGGQLPKCCRLGEVLENGGCVLVGAEERPMKVRVDGGMVTFEWLKERKMLQESAMPNCVKPGEVYPDFSETGSFKQRGPQLTSDGVFVHELQYFLPNAFCVDQSRAVSEYDSYDYELSKNGISEERTDGAYILVMTCEEKARESSVCPKQGVCHPSCCEAWEELGKGNRCELQASLSGDGGQVQGGGGKTSPKSGGATSMPGGYRPSSTKPQTPAAQPECKLRRAHDWKLEAKGVREGAILHQTGSYCLAGEEALVCDDEDEVVHVKAQQVTLAERSNGPSLATTTNLLSSFLIFCLFNLVSQPIMLPSV